MLSIVTWKWKNNVGWINYTSEHVNHLRCQVERFIGVPYKFFCITDDSTGLHHDIISIPIEIMSANVPAYTNHCTHLRSCFRRLRLFSPKAEKIFGKRIMQIDIDMVITGDISHIAKRTEPFLIWRSYSQGRRHYALNTSLILMDAGARSDIWEQFNADIEGVSKAARHHGWNGTDQAVIAYLSEKKEPPTFGKQDGIYAFRDDPKECQGDELAQQVKVISFHDRFDPADPKLHKQCKWLDRAWRESSDNIPMFSMGEQIQSASCQRSAEDDRPQL
jgi:hypothetical protein